MRSSGGSRQHIVPFCRHEERADLEAEALDLPVDLRSCPDLWSRVLGSEQKDEIADTSGRDEHLTQTQP